MLRKVSFVLACCGAMTAGEMAPQHMLALLREKWGVGRHLARALLAHYGGHGKPSQSQSRRGSSHVGRRLIGSCLLDDVSVWETYKALAILSRSDKRAKLVGLDPLKCSRVKDCLKWLTDGEADAHQRTWMLMFLRNLATHGFAPLLSKDDEVAAVGGHHALLGGALL